MKRTWQIPRRTFLRGLGTAMALPALEAMVPPLRALASEATNNPVGAASVFPRRMAFIYIPNGVNMADWTPQAAGEEFELPFILEPLAPLKADLQVLSGLAHDKARPHGDGPGDHARASATFLTGCQARKTAGADIRIGVSVDQIAAARLGQATRLPSLELSAEKRTRPSGDCDSGYSCAYQFNLSWKSETTPLPPEVDPRLAFERLFGNGIPGETEQSRAARLRHRKSILDFVMDDAAQLQKNLGRTDQRKLEEYLAAVRELETRIDTSERFAAALPEQAQPHGFPKDNEKHIRLLYDVLALAFQTDTTRIATYLIAHDGDDRHYPELGITEGHHTLSHHGNDEVKKGKIAKINRFHATQFAYFLEKLKAVKEGDGTLLDHCMIVYGAAIGDGNAHNHDNLPVLLAGRGGGTLEAGRHVRYPRETPMTNLYLSMLDRFGVTVDRVGDSSGKLQNI